LIGGLSEKVKRKAKDALTIHFGDDPVPPTSIKFWEYAADMLAFAAMVAAVRLIPRGRE
jgi:hypothetical protein